MNIVPLLVAALLGAAPHPATPDADPTVAIFAAVAAEFVTLAEGEPRAVTVDPRWREPYPIPLPDTVLNLDRVLFATEPMANPLRASLRERLAGIELCEAEAGVEGNRCIESGENVHLAFAPLALEGDRVHAQVVGWWRVTPERALTVVELWELTLELDGERATIVGQERVMQGHGTIRTP